MENNDEKEKNNAHFVTALIYMADRRGLDSQALATRAGITQRMVDYIFSRSKNAGRGSAISLSSAVGLDYADMLRLGRLIGDGVPGDEAFAQIGGRDDFPSLSSHDTSREGSAFDTVLSSLTLQIGEWLHSVCGDNPQGAMAFAEEFGRRFPEFTRWRCDLPVAWATAESQVES